MRERNFRATVVAGTFTLPVTATLAAVLWLTSGWSAESTWTGLLATALITYLLVELNNRNALLRVRSRMVSSTFLGLVAACPFFYHWSPAIVPALCLVAAYFPLFAAYQRPRPAAWVFHAALLLGAGSLCYPPLLLLLPVMIWCLLVHLRALDWRSFLATIFGAALPYWFLVGIGVWEHRLDTIFLPYLAAFRFTAPDYAALSLPQTLTAAYVLLLSLIAIIHFSRTAYNDKIRTRMYFYVFIVFEIVLILALAAQPQRADVLLRLLIVNSAPLIAHHFTLGHGRSVNVWFILCIAGLLGIICFNLFTTYAGSR